MVLGVRASGAGHRIDLMALPQAWLRAVTSTALLCNIPLGAVDWRDHVAPTADLRLGAPSRPHSRPPRPTARQAPMGRRSLAPLGWAPHVASGFAAGRRPQGVLPPPAVFSDVALAHGRSPAIARPRALVQTQPAHPATTPHSPWRRSSAEWHLALARAQAALGRRRLARIAASASRAARTSWLEVRVRQVAAAAQRGDAAPVWRLVRSLAGRRHVGGLGPRQVLRDIDGTILGSPTQQADMWLRRFGREFQGNVELCADSSPPNGGAPSGPLRRWVVPTHRCGRGTSFGFRPRPGRAPAGVLPDRRPCALPAVRRSCQRRGLSRHPVAVEGWGHGAGPT